MALVDHSAAGNGETKFPLTGEAEFSQELAKDFPLTVVSTSLLARGPRGQLKSLPVLHPLGLEAGEDFHPRQGTSAARVLSSVVLHNPPGTAFGFIPGRCVLSTLPCVSWDELLSYLSFSPQHTSPV